MTKKPILSIIILILICYVSISYYASYHYKILILNELKLINNDNINLSYENISVSSPLIKPSLKINNVKVKIPFKINNYDDHEFLFEQINIRSNFSLNKFVIEFPREISTNSNGNKFLIKYDQPIQIKAKFNKTFLFSEQIDFTSLVMNIDNINIYNGNYIIRNISNNQITYEGDHTFFNLNQKVAANRIFNLKSSIESSNHNYNITSQKIITDIDLSLTPKNGIDRVEFQKYELNLKKLQIKLDDLSFDVKGNATGDQSEVMPIGEVLLTVKNIDTLPKYLNGKSKEDVENIFLKLYNDISVRKPDNISEIIIKREKKDKFYFNNKSFMDIVMSYYKISENK